MADTLLKVDGINVYYGNIHAVKDISFTVNAGEIVTLIGANGAGKSTTLKTISGLLKPRTGDVLYKGKSIKGVRAHKIVESGLAQVPEGRHVFLHMTVDENLDMGAYTQPASTIAANKEKVFTLFPRLKERRKQLAGTMSGGEQQMLAMGRALMSNASMLMLDEPSMGLSPLLVQEIFDIIRDIHKEGMTILLVEQNAQMALSVADRAYVLETGFAKATPRLGKAGRKPHRMRGKRYEQDHHPGKLQTRAEPVRHPARHRHGEAAVCRYPVRYAESVPRVCTAVSGGFHRPERRPERRGAQGDL